MGQLLKKAGCAIHSVYEDPGVYQWGWGMHFGIHIHLNKQFPDISEAKSNMCPKVNKSRYMFVKFWYQKIMG